MSDVRWLNFKLQISNFKVFCALGREKIFAGLKQIFRCLARRFHHFHRRYKGTKFSLRSTNKSPTISRFICVCVFRPPSERGHLVMVILVKIVFQVVKNRHYNKYFIFIYSEQMTEPEKWN